MLQKIHDKATGWFAGVLLALLAVVFVFWGIDFGFGSVSYAAKVDGTKIRAEDVRRLYQMQLTRFQQMYGGEVPAEIRTELQNSLLEGFVRDELLVQHSTDLGYSVSDAQVMKTYHEIPAFQIDGKFSADVAQRRLLEEGISPAQFERQQRRSLQVRQLQEAIANSAFVTPAELERAHRLQAEQREIAWLVIPASNFLPSATADDAAIQAYYDKHKSQYMTPESVALKYIELKLEDVAQEVQVTETALREHYEAVKDRYIEQERRRARHILIQAPPEGDAAKNAAAETAARKKADEVLAKAKAGEDFSKLAKEYSQDTGSAANGGDLNWSDRTVFVAPFADAVFSMKADEIRGPVRTQFGYHIIRLDGIQPGKQKTFEEVRADLEREYRTQEAEKIFGERQEQLANKAFENLNDLDKVAQALKLPVREVPLFERGKPGSLQMEMTAFPKIEEAAFSETVLGGQNSAPIELKPGHVVVLRASSHREPAQRPLTEVREQIVTAVKTERSREQALQAAQQSIGRLQAGSETLQRLATELKIKAEGPKFLGRTDSSLPTELRNQLFALPRPAGQSSYRALPLGNGDAAVMVFSAARVPTEAEMPAERTERTERARQLVDRNKENELSGYVTALRKDAKIVKNAKLFD